jgi:hypothetical protein
VISVEPDDVKDLLDRHAKDPDLSAGSKTGDLEVWADVSWPGNIQRVIFIGCITQPDFIAGPASLAPDLFPGHPREHPQAIDANANLVLITESKAKRFARAIKGERKFDRDVERVDRPDLSRVFRKRFRFPAQGSSHR